MSQSTGCRSSLGNGAALILLMVLFSRFLVAQSSWEQAPGPTAGRIEAMALDSQGQTLAGTDEGGIFRYDPARNQWKYLDLTQNTIRSLFRRSDGVLFAGTSYDLYASTNDGINWNLLPLPRSMSLVSIEGTVGGYLFIGGWGGMARSSDEGQTWEEIDAGLPSDQIQTILVDSSRTVWVGLYRDGLHRSTDNGSSWSSVGSLFDYKDVSDILISSTGHVFVTMDGDALARSTDGGATWEFITNGFEDYRLEQIIESKNGTLYCCSRRGRIYQSTDNGSRWTTLFTESNGVELFSIIEAGDGALFAGTNWSGIYRSTDAGVTWLLANTGLTNNNIPSVCVTANGELFVVSETYQRVQYSSNGGDSWEGRTGGTNIGLRKLYIDQTDRLFGTTYYGLVYSTNEGSSWTQDSVGMGDKNLSTFCITPGGTMLVGTFTGAIYRSTVLNGTWMRVRQGAGTELSCIAVTVDGSLYAADRGSGLIRSTDDGLSWSAIQNPTAFTNYTALLTDQNELYVGGFGSLDRTSDAGQHWESVGANLPDEWVRALLFLEDRTLAAGFAYRGVYYLSAGLTDWMPLNSGLTNRNILSLAQNATGTLYAGTAGNGLFRYQWRPTDIQSVSVGIATLLLHQNFPNPASGETRLRFTISPQLSNIGRQDADTRLRIFDLLGRLIAEPYHGELPPGEYSMPWNPGDIPGGMYICRLESGGRSVARSIIVAQ